MTIEALMFLADMLAKAAYGLTYVTAYYAQFAWNFVQSF